MHCSCPIAHQDRLTLSRVCINQHVHEYLVCLSLRMDMDRTRAPHSFWGHERTRSLFFRVYASMAYGRKRKHEQLKRRRAKERNCTDTQPCLYVQRLGAGLHTEPSPFLRTSE